MEEEFKDLLTLQEQYAFKKTIGIRSDLEYYNNVKYKAYMKGMISLQINHHQEEFMSSVQNLLLRMRVILKQYSNNEHLQNYGKKLTFDKFLKMDDSDLVEFNRVYEEFVKLRAEKDERIAQKRNEEIAESIKRNINMRYNLNLMKTEEDEEQKIGLTKGPTFRATQPEEIKLSIEEDSIDSMSGASKDEPGIFQLQQKQKLQKENKTLFEDFLNQRKEEVDESIETEEMLLEEDLCKLCT